MADSENTLLIKIQAEIDGLQKELKAAQVEIESFGDKTKKSFDKSADASKPLIDGVKSSGAAMRQLDTATGGLSTSLLGVAKAAKLSGTAMRSALIASGIGALIVALGLIIDHWDSIKTFIFGADEAMLKYQRDTVGFKRASESIKGHIKTVKLLREQYKLLGYDQSKLIEREEILIKRSIQSNNERKKVLQDLNLVLIDRAKIAQANDDDESLKELQKQSADLEKEFIDLTNQNIALSISLIELQHEIGGVVIEMDKVVKPTKDAIQALKDLQKLRLAEDQFDLEQLKIRRKELEGFFKPLSNAPEFVRDLDKYSQSFKKLGQELKDNIPDFAKETGIELAKVTDEFNVFESNMRTLIAGQLSSTLNTLGVAIGEALGGAGDVTQTLGERLLGFFGKLLAEFGAVLITLGTGIIIADAAFKSGNGYAAIAAGVAMVALGAFFAIKSSQGIQMASGASSGSTAGVGSSSGGSYSQTNYSGNTAGGTYVFEIEGTKLVGVLSNTLSRNRALGGSLSII